MSTRTPSMHSNFIVAFPASDSRAMTRWESRKAWTLVKEESTFVDWQRVKVQENSDEVCPYAPIRSYHIGSQTYHLPARAG